MTRMVRGRTAAADMSSWSPVEPAACLAGIRAFLLDVDGTLYRQTPVRLWMACEMGVVSPLTYGVSQALRLGRAIAEFRKVREELRALGAPSSPLVELQYRETARRAGVTAGEVEATVSEWMFSRPLKYVARAPRSRVASFLIAARRAGLLIGALSDYPVADKLAALGLSDYFSLRLCTTDREINALKPHPRGFLEACRVWGLSPLEVLYVGDRPDVDATGARAAGMRCAIVGQSARSRAGRTRSVEYLAVGGFANLEALLASA